MSRLNNAIIYRLPLTTFKGAARICKRSKVRKGVLCMAGLCPFRFYGGTTHFHSSLSQPVRRYGECVLELPIFSQDYPHLYLTPGPDNTITFRIESNIFSEKKTRQ